MYPPGVPKLWNETIDAHRQAVRDATLDATAALVAEHGLTGVTMSQIATKTGIGRATLYKYFPDIEAILSAWHERQIRSHLAQLAEIRDQEGDTGERLEKVLRAYALIQQQRARHHENEPRGTELAALLHPGEHIAQAQHHLHAMFRDLLAEAAATGDIRDDIATGELASYCLHALTAAGTLPSPEAAERLVTVTLAGLRPPS
jgi:AcrR family transcriptional regulator